MPTLETTFAGIQCINPFWLASAPPTNCGEQVMRAFDAGARGIGLAKLLRCLIVSSGLQRLKIFACLQRDDTRLDLRPSAAAPHWAGGAVFSREARLELHAALGVGARQP